MKFLLSFLLLAIPLSASSQKLDDKKIIIWPRYDWTDSEFENLAESRLQQGDGLIMSYFAGMKDGFRSSKYAINKRKVLLQFPALPEASQMEDFILKKQNGIGGQFIEIASPSASFDLNTSNLSNILLKGEKLGSRQIFAIDYATARRPANLKLLSSYVDTIALYPERVLTAKRKTVLNFIEKTTNKLHDLNPELEVWLAFNLLTENNNPEEIIDFLRATPTNIEGFIITFRHSSENIADASQLLSLLRPLESGS